ncbi:DUF192 domain-containing protein [Frigidibacter oleivorans]|uniref:DUF192 domain-containing protein n=1 Tax=Frigidibacter oleivorans TaxID=2487129 RepID=UPI000F8ECF38
MPRRRIGWGAALAVPALLLLALVRPVTAQEAACDPGRVDLRWPGGAARFSVEIADTPGERARGLMHRERLARGAGMLFVYPAEAPAAFWMKNTLIPLDILFFDGAGRLLTVQADAVPGDETPLPGGDRVQFVLEINGGLAARLGLGEAAELRHPAIPAATAAWPCG